MGVFCSFREKGANCTSLDAPGVFNLVPNYRPLVLTWCSLLDEARWGKFQGFRRLRLCFNWIFSNQPLSENSNPSNPQSRRRGSLQVAFSWINNAIKKRRRTQTVEVKLGSERWASVSALAGISEKHNPDPGSTVKRPAGGFGGLTSGGAALHCAETPVQISALWKSRAEKIPGDLTTTLRI